MPARELQVAMLDRLTRPLEQAGLATRRRQVLSHATGRVLDVGAGTGANLPHYRGVAAVDRVVALEPEPAAARRLLHHIDEAGVPTPFMSFPDDG